MLTRTQYVSLIAILAIFATGSTASARDLTETAVDNRPAATATVPAAVIDARHALKAQFGPLGVVSTDPETGAARSIMRINSPLTGPTLAPTTSVALDYVRDHADVFGLDNGDINNLKLIRHSDGTDVDHLVFGQSYKGIPSADSALTANLNPSHGLINLSGPVIPDLTVPSINPQIDAETAYDDALKYDGGKPSTSAATTANDPTQTTTFPNGGKGSLVIYQSNGSSHLGWDLTVPVNSIGVYSTLVSADTGRVVSSHNLVKFANALVYDNYPGATVGGTQTSQSITGYLNAGATTLTGNNAHVFSDPNDAVTTNPNVTIDPANEVGPGPAGGATDWNYPFTAMPGYNCGTTCAWDGDTANSWQTNRKQDATQLFWYVNKYHDHLAAPPFNFNESSGNFQVSNGANGGVGGDPVLAQSMDGANTAAVAHGATADCPYANPTSTPGFPDKCHTDNANFRTYPDGTPGLMQMYLFYGESNSWGDYSGADEADIVYHEYTHGFSSRLITYPDGSPALNTVQAGAMGEAMSDFFAMDFLNEQGYEVDGPAVGDLKIGSYVDNGTDQVRTEGMDCTVGTTSPLCPGAGTAGAGGYTYADFGKIAGGPEVHSDGEIWGQTLWQIRQQMIANHGLTEGLLRARRYIVGGMRTVNPEPSFLDMRDAIILASPDLNDRVAMYAIFAQRGMGINASTNGSDDAHPVAGFAVPSPGSLAPPANLAPRFNGITISATSKLKIKRGKIKVTLIYGNASLPGKGVIAAFVGKPSNNKSVGFGSFKVVPATTATVSIKLTAKGKRLLRKKRSLKVTLLVTANKYSTSKRATLK